MGIDINIYPEHRLSDAAGWMSLCGAFNAPRDRELFQLMGLANCGLPDQPAVASLFSLKGLPHDLGWEANANSHISVDGDWRPDYNVTHAEAAALVREGKASWADERELSILDPDLRGPTWLSADEYKLVLNASSNVAAEWWGLLALLEEIERRGSSTRLVIWFDD
jgi:hypothetical protein